METTKREYIEQKHTELFNKLGCFWAFNTEQFKEGIEKAGGIENTGKYVSCGSGLYCPSKNVDELLKGFENIKKQWEEDRKAHEKIKLIFVGIDNWNRPVWRDPDKSKKAYFGDVCNLFSWGASEEEVRTKITDVYSLCYFGDHFGCEPMGTEVPDIYYI